MGSMVEWMNEWMLCFELDVPARTPFLTWHVHIHRLITTHRTTGPRQVLAVVPGSWTIAKTNPDTTVTLAFTRWKSSMRLGCSQTDVLLSRSLLKKVKTNGTMSTRGNYWVCRQLVWNRTCSQNAGSLYFCNSTNDLFVAFSTVLTIAYDVAASFCGGVFKITGQSLTLPRRWAAFLIRYQGSIGNQLGGLELVLQLGWWPELQEVLLPYCRSLSWRWRCLNPLSVSVSMELWIRWPWAGFHWALFLDCIRYALGCFPAKGVLGIIFDRHWFFFFTITGCNFGARFDSRGARLCQLHWRWWSCVRVVASLEATSNKQMVGFGIGWTRPLSRVESWIWSWRTIARPGLVIVSRRVSSAGSSGSSTGTPSVRTEYRSAPWLCGIGKGGYSLHVFILLAILCEYMCVPTRTSQYQYTPVVVSLEKE